MWSTTLTKRTTTYTSIECGTMQLRETDIALQVFVEQMLVISSQLLR